MDEFFEKGFMAAKKCLINRGYEILDTSFSDHIDFVVSDGDDLRFINFSVRRGRFATEINPSRNVLEDEIGNWLAYNTDKVTGDNVAVHYDRLDLRVLNSEKAFVRHHFDVLD